MQGLPGSVVPLVADTPINIDARGFRALSLLLPASATYIVSYITSMEATDHGPANAAAATAGGAASLVVVTVNWPYYRVEVDDAAYVAVVTFDDENE